MPYTVRLRPRAQRSLDRLAQEDRDRIVSALRMLEDNPRPRGIRKLRSRVQAWRVRVGDFRIIYALFAGDRLVVVGAIERRSERTYEDIEKLFGEE